MKKVSRRTVLQVMVPATVAGLAIPASAADQPHMKSALNALRNAKQQLSLATADKGGHRAKAMELVNQAISEVEKGISYDRRR